MKRNVLLGGLLMLNIGLLLGLVSATAPPKSAMASMLQDAAPGLSSNYMVVSGEVQDQFDALYVLDVKTRALYAFVWDRGARQFQLKAARDLQRDFRNE